MYPHCSERFIQKCGIGRRAAKQPKREGMSEMGHIELTNAPCNQILEIMMVKDASWEKRFEAMGIRKGRRIRKIATQPFGGPIVIEISGSKMSLGRNIAAKIEVEVLAHPSS